MLSLLVFQSISMDFTPTPTVPSAPNILNSASFFCISKVELWIFNKKLNKTPTDALRPINPDNARGLCITAAAGTELATSYSVGTVTNSSLLKAVYTPKGFFLHAASLHQTFVHCGIFLTAASRRSLGSVSVPVRQVTLSRLLPVVALVGFYPAN